MNGFYQRIDTLVYLRENFSRFMARKTLVRPIKISDSYFYIPRLLFGSLKL